MTNFQVYRKTISFSFLGFLVDILAFAVLFGSAAAGFFIADRGPSSKALIGLVVGFVVGIVLAILINVFLTNRIKAAQISMIVKGVTEGELPDHTFSEGFKEIKGRFGKITAFYFITRAIRAIFQQLGRAINRVGTALGGQTGDTITSIINSAFEVLIGFLCDCCLGWILYRKEESAAKAGCEGAVIFFKHGKTLIRNIGRIFGLGLLSLLVIGGGFFGLFYLIVSSLPQALTLLINEMTEAATRGGTTLPPELTNPAILSLIIAGVAALILWSMFHSVLVRPFILVGVMRNYMAAGIQDMPTEKDFAELDAKSPRFARLHKSI